MNNKSIYVWTMCLLVLALAFASASAGERTQSFATKKGEALEVRIDGGNIAVRGWDKDEVAVRVRSLNEDQLKAVTMNQGGGKVVIEFRWGKKNVENMDFDISVPSTFDAIVRTAGGELAFYSPLTGALKGTTAGGDVKLGDLGGSIRMETAGGEITAGKIAGDLTVRTAGGDIRVQSVTEAAEISTAGGEIVVNSAGKTLRASTAGGDIEIGKVGGEMAVSTAGGNIKVESGQGNLSLTTAGGNILLKSARGSVHASTSAGNITVEDVRGALSARSAAGDVFAAIDPSADESSSIATSAGSITLRIAESAHATIVARSRGPFDGSGDESQIQSDFPITRNGSKHGDPETEVVLNGGGHKITLETMIGGIRIKKLK
jgi:DUF4097 and DUF4098 domain-containing protein YvlB